MKLSVEAVDRTRWKLADGENWIKGEWADGMRMCLGAALIVGTQPDDWDPPDDDESWSILARVLTLPSGIRLDDWVDANTGGRFVNPEDWNDAGYRAWAGIDGFLTVLRGAITEEGTPGVDLTSVD